MRRLVLFALALLAAVVIDAWFWDLTQPWGERSHWEMLTLLRVVGYLPAWVLAAGTLVVIDRVRHRGGRIWAPFYRALPLLGAAAVAGLVAEGLKLVVRRERPEYHDGEHVFRALAERTFDNGGLGFPSGHTAVAFGAAFALARLFPAGRPAFYAVAAGCGLSRAVVGAHFLSDVVGGAGVGMAAGWLIWRLHVRLNRRHIPDLDPSAPAPAPGGAGPTGADAPGPGPGLPVAGMRRLDRLWGIPACLALTVLRRLAGDEAPDAPPPRRIAFIKLAEQGSTVLAAPAVRAAATRVGRENVYFVVFAANRFVLDAMDLLPPENVLPIRAEGRRRVLIDAVRVVRRLRALRVDAVIDLEFLSRSSACLAFLSRAGRRVGLHAFGGEGPWRGDLFTHRLRHNPHLHAQQAFRLMVDALDADPAALPRLERTPPPLEAPPRFVPGDDERASLRARLAAAAGGTAPSRLVLLNPNCSDLLPLRAWPRARYVALARRLLDADPGLRVALTGAPGEAPALDGMAATVADPRCFSLAGRTTLRDLLVLYTLADVLVTNDSGPAHFAALTPIDVVTLFGPETPALFAAPGPRSHVLHAGLACSPCVSALNNRTTPCTDNRCLQAIEVETVAATVLRCLRGRELPVVEVGDAGFIPVPAPTPRPAPGRTRPR